jgi:ubiquinol-cytochrome c reductase cytochrome c1 subunit
MIIGMPRQLHDGMLDYEDGTPASTPQMANDVSNFLCYMQRRQGFQRPDKEIRKWMIVLGLVMLAPFKYLKVHGLYKALFSHRSEMYAVRDSLGYKHWKTGMISSKSLGYRGVYWC